MALRLDSTIEVTLDVDGEEVIAVFPGYLDEKLQMAQKKLLTGRHEIGRRGKIVDHTFEARVKFFDAACQEVKGLEAKGGSGEYLALSPDNFQDWQERVPVNLKASFAAVFEEKSRLTDDEKNS